MSSEKTWEICAKCSKVVEIDDEGACDCMFRGDTPERITVIPAPDHSTLQPGERERLERLVRGLRQVAGPKTEEAVNVAVAAQNVHAAADFIDAALANQEPQEGGD